MLVAVEEDDPPNGAQESHDIGHYTQDLTHVQAISLLTAAAFPAP